MKVPSTVPSLLFEKCIVKLQVICLGPAQHELSVKMITNNDPKRLIFPWTISENGHFWRERQSFTVEKQGQRLLSQNTSAVRVMCIQHSSTLSSLLFTTICLNGRCTWVDAAPSFLSSEPVRVLLQSKQLPVFENTTVLPSSKEKSKGRAHGAL